MEFISFAQFSRDYGVAKSTIYDAKRFLGLDTSKGIRLEDVPAIAQELGITPKEISPLVGDVPIDAELVCASISVMSQDRATVLDGLLTTFQGLDVYKPKQVELNGSQDAIADLLQTYASKIQAKEKEETQRQAAIADRQAKIQKADQALAAMQGFEKGLEAQALETNTLAADVKQEESRLKKQLAEALAAIG
jgi:hypothetical protein